MIQYSIVEGRITQAVTDIKTCSKVKENLNNPCELRGFSHCFVQHGSPILAFHIQVNARPVRQKLFQFDAVTKATNLAQFSLEFIEWGEGDNPLSRIAIHATMTTRCVVCVVAVVFSKVLFVEQDDFGVLFNFNLLITVRSLSINNARPSP